MICGIKILSFFRKSSRPALFDFMFQLFLLNFLGKMLVINDKSLLNYFFRISIRYHDPILFNRILQEDDWIRLKTGKEGDGVKAKIKILYTV